MPLTYNGITVQNVNYKGSPLSSVTYKGVEVWSSAPSTYAGLCFTANTANSTVELTASGSPSISDTAYSFDGRTWVAFTPSSTAGTNVVTLTNVGDKVYFRNNITGNFALSKYLQFKMSGSIAASGNVNSLYNATNFEALTALTYTYCYRGLFFDCASLTTPPVLPAITLSSNCYRYMFYGCTSLTTVPVLPATTLVSDCYNYMFGSCTSLQVSDTQTSEASYAWKIPSFDAFTSTESQSSMFYGCKGTRSSNDMPGEQGQSYTYYTQNRPVQKLPDYLCFAANTAGSTVELIKVGSPSISNTAYSRDGITWTTFTPSETAGTNVITLENIGDKVYFRNNITGDFSNSNYLQFIMNFNISASGNINSMHSAENFENLTTLTYKACYSHLFVNCTALTTPPKLPATALTEACYNQMFLGCTYLQVAPKLPATRPTSYCYNAMFENCSTLVTPPELPATTLAPYCYASMFLGCKKLVTAPSLPASTMQERCYEGMFNGCTALVATPVLPATTLADCCYYRMFGGCTSLTTITNFPATTLANRCYLNMFSGCTSLQISDSQTEAAPYELKIPSSNTFTNTYQQNDMFYQCAGTRSSDYMPGVAGQSYTYYTQNPPLVDYLCFTANIAGSTIAMTRTSTAQYLHPDFSYSTDKITWNTFTPGTTTITLARIGDKVYFKGTNDTCKYWGDVLQFSLTGSIAASGDLTTILRPEGNVLDLSSLGSQHTYTFFKLFYSCSALTSAPRLPSTTLTMQCYQQMFNGCINLTAAPELPATTLDTSCYNAMFASCYALQSIPAELPATTLTEGCYGQMFNQCNNIRSSESIDIKAQTLAQTSMESMFLNTSIMDVTVHFTDWTYDGTNLATTNWLGTRSTGGTLTCPIALDTSVRDASHVRDDWNVVKV